VAQKVRPEMAVFAHPARLGVESILRLGDFKGCFHQEEKCSFLTPEGFVEFFKLKKPERCDKVLTPISAMQKRVYFFL